MESGLVGAVIQDPFERVSIRVSACMIAEPKHYESSEKRVSDIVNDLNEIVDKDPEFVIKLAYYSRNQLNLRSTSNFLLAWAASKPQTHSFLTEYFNFIINLPSDLLDFIEKYNGIIGNTGVPKFPSFIQSLAKGKFTEFSQYQLGKYCSEGKRKRMLMKGKKQKITMKLLVRCCHIKKPAHLVAAIIGKRYPKTVEEFAKSSFSEYMNFNPEMAGKRMKIHTPYTWETTLSEKGNKAECWEDLIKSNKLPFMATLRNLRNLLITGVDFETHRKVVEKLRNPDVIANSRLFPFRFLSAFESLNIDLEYLEKIKEDPNYEETDEEKAKKAQARIDGFERFRGSIRPQRSEVRKPKKNKRIPNIVPTPDIINGYKESLEEAIRLATALNISPIRGHSVIFCDASGSMQCKISSGPMGSIRTCMDLGYLFGLMLRHVCESCDVYLLSSPNPPQTPKCWRKVELSGDNIFDLLSQVRKVSDEMGRSNEYPYDWFENVIKEKSWIDNIIIFSDMIISDTCSEMFDSNESYTSYQILQKYRDEVNPNLRYITVDLAGYARDMSGANFENQFKNLVIGGYSDAILKLISCTQTTQAGAVRACKPVKRSEIDN